MTNFENAITIIQSFTNPDFYEDKTLAIEIQFAIDKLYQEKIELSVKESRLLLKLTISANEAINNVLAIEDGSLIEDLKAYQKNIIELLDFLSASSGKTLSVIH